MLDNTELKWKWINEINELQRRAEKAESLAKELEDVRLEQRAVIVKQREEINSLEAQLRGIRGVEKEGENDGT